MAMKTGILVLAVLITMGVSLKAQPVPGNIRTFKGMNSIRSDSDFKGLMRTTIERQRRMNQQGLLRALDLSEEQIKAIKEIQLTMHKEVKPLLNQLNEAEAHQKTLVSADEPNIKSINDNLEKVGELKTDIQKVRIKYLLEMKSKLTDEQRMKLDMMRHHRRFMGHGAGKMNFGSNSNQRRIVD